MSGEDFIIKVGADFKGVETGIARLRKSLADLESRAKSPQRVAQYQEARKSLTNIEGAGRAVSERAGQVGKADLSAQRRLAGLAALVAKESKLPGGIELAIRKYFASINTTVKGSILEELVAQTKADLPTLQKRFASQKKPLATFVADESTRVATSQGAVPSAVKRLRKDIYKEEAAERVRSETITEEFTAQQALKQFVAEIEQGIALWTQIVANLKSVSVLAGELALLQKRFNAAVSKDLNTRILSDPGIERELDSARQPGRLVRRREGNFDAATDVTELLGLQSLSGNDLVDSKAIGDVRRQLLSLLSSELLTEEQRLAISREVLGSENMILALTQAQTRHKLELQALDATQKALVAQAVAAGKLTNVSDIAKFTRSSEAQILKLTQERVMQLMTDLKLQTDINAAKKQIKAATDKIVAQQLGIVVAGDGAGGRGGGRVAPGAGAGGTDQPKNLWQKLNFGAGALGTLRYGVPSMLMYAGFGAMTNAVQTANDLQLEFSIIEDQLNSIGQSDAFEHIEQSVLDTAKATGQSVSDLARLERQLIGAFSGIDPGSALGAMDFTQLAEEQMRSAGQLAEVVGLPLTEITDGLTASSLAFDKTFGEIGDVVVALENNTGVLGKETVNFLGDIAPVAKEAGFSMEQMSVLAAQVQQRSGRSGTALAEQFNRIIPAVSAAKSELLALAATEESLGTPEFIDALYNNDIATVLRDIGQAYGDLGTSSQTAIVNLLGGRREAGALIPALANIDQFNDLMHEAEDSAGSLEARFTKVRETIANTLDRLRESAKQLFLTIYEGGLDSLLQAILEIGDGLIKILDPAFDMLGKFLNLMGGLPATMLIVAVAVKGLSAAYVKLAESISAVVVAERLRATAQASSAVQAAAIPFALVGPTGGNAGMQQIPLPTKVPLPYAGMTGPVAAPSATSRLAGVGAGLSRGLGGPMGIALIAATTFWSSVNSAADGWRKDTQGIVDEMTAADASTQDLLREAEQFERGLRPANDPGWWQKLASAVTGKKVLSKSAALRAEAFRQEEASTLAIADAMTEDKEGFNEALKGKFGHVDFGDAGITTPGLELQRKYEEEIQKEIERKIELAEAVGLQMNDQGELQNASREEAAAYNDLLNAIQNSKDPVADIVTMKDDPGTSKEAAEIYVNFLESWVSLLGQIDPDLAEKLQAIIGASDAAADETHKKINESRASVEVLAKQYEVGGTRTQELVAALRQEINKLEQLDVDNPEALVDVAKQINEYRKQITEVLQGELDALNRIFDYGGEDNIDTINRKLFTATAMFNQRQQTPEGVLEEYDQIREYLVQRRQWMADQASSEEEASKILAQEIDLPPDLQLRAAVNALRSLGVQVDVLQNVTVEGFEELSGAWLDVALAAYVSGNESAEQLIKRLEHAQSLIAQALAKAIDDAVARSGSLLDRISNINRLKNQFREVQELLDRAQSGLLAPFTQGIPGEENEGREKETKDSMRQAETALKLAQARGNSAAEAMIRLEDARLAYMEAVADEESKADDIEARAAMIEAERDLAQTLNDRANEYRKAAAGFQSAIGNSVEAAEQETVIAIQEYQFAIAQYGADSPQTAAARTSLAQALVAQRNAMQQRKDAFVDLLLGLNKMDEDAVVVAQAEVNLAQQQLNEALGIDDRLSAQKRMLDAQKQLNQAMNEVRISQMELRQAELDAYEDEIGSANIAVQIAQQQLADAQAAGAGQATINGLQAQLIAARKSADDTRIQEARENYDFLYEMEQITKTEYIQYLESLKSALRPGTDAFKDLELTIKRLKDDISSDLQTNLPTALSLPTLYEVRRLAGTTGLSQTTGQAIGYQDNRNMNVQIYVNNGMSPEQVVSAFTTAVGLGRNGYDPRIY
jgi:TP901 family phage tail tape measure protein